MMAEEAFSDGGSANVSEANDQYAHGFEFKSGTPNEVPP
jgi:hypothetical protein